MAQVHAHGLPSFRSRRINAVEVRHALPSQIAAIAPIVDELMSLIAASRNADGSETDIEIALREALANAIIHGNHEDPGKHVEIACRCGADGAVDITIRDEGAGFDNHSVPDPTTPGGRMGAHGRGLYLMRSLMDEVRFEDRGRTVHMRKGPNA